MLVAKSKAGAVGKRAIKIRRLSVSKAVTKTKKQRIKTQQLGIGQANERVTGDGWRGEGERGGIRREGVSRSDRLISTGLEAAETIGSC